MKTNPAVAVESEFDDAQDSQIDSKINTQFFNKHKNTQIQDLIGIATQKTKRNTETKMNRTQSAGNFNFQDFTSRYEEFGRKIMKEETRSIRENKKIVNNLGGCLSRYKKIKNDVNGTDNNNVIFKDIIVA